MKNLEGYLVVYKNYTYLITGGAGFIGSHFVRHLIEKGIKKESIVVLDKLTYAGNLNNLKGCSHLDYYFYQGDICDVNLVDDILKTHQITCVVNFAAESHVDKSIEQQDSFVHTNYLGVQNLLDRTYKFWKQGGLIHQALFVQISTDEVYGSSSGDDSVIFDETSPLKPSNPYASTKAAADLLIGAYENTYLYPSMIVRSTNNYGSNQHAEKFIPKIIKCLLDNWEIPLYGTGCQKRTWLHVEDNCNRIFELIHRGSLGEIYNIVGSRVIENRDLIDLLIESYQEMGHTFKGQVKHVPDRLGHDFFYRVSDKKLVGLLGAYEQIPFEEGIKKLLKASESGYKSKREVGLMFTKWNQDLVTGVTFMDEEHKEILLRSEQLHELLLCGHLAAYQKGLIELLLDYISHHLKHEEELQRVIGFHLFEEHLVHHEEFRQWTKEIEEQAKHAILSKEELLILDLEINEWLVNHILNEDMLIADYHQHRKANGLNP
jgi:dTDP-glucose 4,6-dehydratase